MTVSACLAACNFLKSICFFFIVFLTVFTGKYQELYMLVRTLLANMIHALVFEFFRLLLFYKFINYWSLFTRPLNISYRRYVPGFPSGKSLSLVGLVLLIVQLIALRKSYSLPFVLYSILYYLITVLQFLYNPDHTVLQLVLTVPFAIWYHQVFKKYFDLYFMHLFKSPISQILLLFLVYYDLELWALIRVASHHYHSWFWNVPAWLLTLLVHFWFRLLFQVQRTLQETKVTNLLFNQYFKACY